MASGQELTGPAALWSTPQQHCCGVARAPRQPHLLSSGLHRTVDTMTASASSPWHASTDSTCKARQAGGRSESTCQARQAGSRTESTCQAPQQAAAVQGMALRAQQARFGAFWIAAPGHPQAPAQCFVRCPAAGSSPYMPRAEMRLFGQRWREACAVRDLPPTWQEIAACSLRPSSERCSRLASKSRCAAGTGAEGRWQRHDTRAEHPRGIPRGGRWIR